MYGLITRIITEPGRRDDLVEILLEASKGMPGCVSYVVARDPTDTDALWVTEVWNAKADHQASLQLPQVQVAVEHGRPFIASVGERFETEPMGGF